MSEKEIKAREYCEKTGSMYFEYTDASNELIDAYESAWDYQQEKINKLISALSNLIHHCVDFNHGAESFVLAMEIEKASQTLKETGNE